MKISFIIPCFNEADNIKPFYNNLYDCLNSTEFEYEVIFVDDGSSDKTYENIKNIYFNHIDNVRCIKFSRNFGKEAAMLAGFKLATGDYICVIDADLQQDPLYALEMIDILENKNNIDMVTAIPDNIKDSKMLAFFKKHFYKIINKISSVDFVNGASDFRVFRKCICDVIVQLPEHDRFSKGIFSLICPNSEYIEYHVKDRNMGNSKWSFWKLFRYAIMGITSFSYVPLLIIATLGVIETICSIIPFVMFIISLTGYIAIDAINLLTIFLLLLLTGINAIAIGIVGIYISKIHKENINRPLYVIKEKLV